MKRRIRFWSGFLLVLLFGVQLFTTRAAVGQSTSGPALVLKASGALTPSMLEYLKRGLRTAELRKAELVVFELNTPGGSIDLMSKIVETILASKTPVVVYVSPGGAMAGSAGAIITLAGHAAAMAPDTIIGASSPVGSQGENLGTTLERKEKEAMKAVVRSLAARRGAEAVALGESFIESARAVSNREARQAGLVDFIAADLDDLLRQLDGFTVTISGQPRRLSTAGLQTEQLPYTLIEQFLAILTNPNIVFLLMTIGVQAILIELSSPGGWVAGFLGVVCLALAAYGIGVLPVNWFGIIFVVIAFVLFILELKAPAHGALTAAGTASFVIGALVLFNSPGVPAFQRVSVPLVLGSGLVMAAVFGTIVAIALRARKAPLRSGRQLLVGQVGVARTELAPSGQVQVASELWSAHVAPGAEALPAGAAVEVLAVEGIRLLVRGKPN